jgi:hypothetical protein
MKTLILLPILFSFTTAFAQLTKAPTPADYKAMSDAIQSPEGLALLVHGIDNDNGSFALTWRDKGDFFKYVMLPMTGRNPEVKKAIATLQRNDKIRVWGSFDLFLKSNQRHLEIDDLRMENPFFNACKAMGLPPYQHTTKVPQDLVDKEEITALVHGVANNGASLEIQYGDANVAVIVPEPARVADLFKGDIVKLRYTLVYPPNGPVHMKLIKGADAVQMVQAIQDVNPKDDDSSEPKIQDQKPDEDPVRCGPLVLYKESPNINSNVFAVKMSQAAGYDWTFTLFNAENPDEFSKIKAKAQAAWDANVATAQCGRNFVWNPNIIVCAKGPGNDSDASQANPQIMVNSAGDITVEVISK